MSEAEMRETIARMLAEMDDEGIRRTYALLIGMAGNRQQEFEEGLYGQGH